MGEWLGYPMHMTLNKAFPLAGSFTRDWHYTLVSAVGPAITLCQALFVYGLIRRSAQKYGYPFLFAAFYLELLSGVMNLSHPNDLGRISVVAGLGLLTIPAVFVAIHGLLVYRTASREQYNLSFNIQTLLWIILFSSVWILVNQKFNVVIL